MALLTFTIEQLLWLADLVSGGRGRTDIAAAVAEAESSGQPMRFGVNAGPPRSIDRGLWQINDYYHAEVSDDCAYRALCNARNAYRISNGWRDFKPWSTFNSGLYLNHMPPVSALAVPIQEPILSKRWKPDNGTGSTVLAPGSAPFGHVGIVPPQPSPNRDYSGKVRYTGDRAGVHGQRVNDAANAINRLPAGRRLPA